MQNKSKGGKKKKKNQEEQKQKKNLSDYCMKYRQTKPFRNRVNDYGV